MRCLQLLALSFVCWSVTAAAKDLRIVNIRVGQGDATLIQGPVQTDGSRINVLFDTGNTSGRDAGNILRTVLRKNNATRLDYLIISHDDADHLGGVAFGGIHGNSFILGYDNAPGAPGDDDGNGISDWLDPGTFELPDPGELGREDDISVVNFVDYGEDQMRDTQAIRKYNGFANSMGNRISVNNQNDVESFAIDLGSGAVMTLLAANGYVRGQTERIARVNSPNEKSLSFLLHYENFDYLISGDLIGRKTGSTEDAKVEEAVGKALVAMDRKLEVLHVNHHGANNASSKAFLDLVKPTIAVISAGNGNRHKHPNNAVLERLADADVYRIIQTEWGTTKSKIPDKVRQVQAIYQGDIVIDTDGQSYEISTSRRFGTEE